MFVCRDSLTARMAVRRCGRLRTIRTVSLQEIRDDSHVIVRRDTACSPAELGSMRAMRGRTHIVCAYGRGMVSAERP